jgi:hypothetical protein
VPRPGPQKLTGKHTVRECMASRLFFSALNKACFRLFDDVYFIKIVGVV